MGLRDRTRSLVGTLSFLAQWLCYRLVERLQFWERDDSLWVFGARGGEAFADNAKYLYLHVAAQHADIRPVWLSKNREVVRELQEEGYEAYYCYSPSGLLLNLRAGVVFLTQGHRDLTMPCCAGALTVLLWHGVPLKKISWDAGFAEEPTVVQRAHADMAAEFDVLTVPGGASTRVFESGLRIDRERMVATGYPRNDALFDSIPGEAVGTDTDSLANVERLSADHPVLFYLPTFREWDGGSVAAQLDFAALDDLLERRDAYLVLKMHPREPLPVDAADFSRVVVLPEHTDVYPFLRHADALVTDYSSVALDYLLLDRPLVFYPFDLDRYREKRGLYFDYDEVTPGPVARNFEDLLVALDGALSDLDAPGEFASERRAVRERLLDDDSPGLDDERSATGRSAAVYDLVQRHLSNAR